MGIKDLFIRVINKCERMKETKSVYIARKEMCNNASGNLFDYNDAIKSRPSPYQEIEINHGLRMYGIGYLLREYSHYKKKVFCQIEHGLTTLRTDNFGEFRDFTGLFAFTCSHNRAKLIRPLTHKIVIPIGPYFMPYTDSFYDEYVIKQCRENFGKTLVVFPIHSNTDNSYDDISQKRAELIEYIEGLREKHGFKTVIACVYYLDIANQAYLEFEKVGWKVVSAGQNTNYDFSARLKAILSISDFVVSQGSYSTICYATWLKKPSIFLKGSSTIRYKDGTEVNIGQKWSLDEISEKFFKLFNSYTNECTSEQIELCNEIGGFDSVKTSEQIKLLFELAYATRRDSSLKHLKLLLKKQKYLPIKGIITEAIENT